MDAEGLDMAVLYPSRGLFVLGLDSVEQIGHRRARARVRDRDRPCVQQLDEGLLRRRPDRMFGAGMVAPHDVDGAVVEARRCVEELGFKAIFLAPATVNRRPWHHPAYDPLWAEIERLDVPIAFHGGGQTYLTPDFSLEVLPEMMLWHTLQPAARHPVRHRVLHAAAASSSASPTCASRCSRATARGRRGSCTASTSTTSGRGGTRRPSSR